MKNKTLLDCENKTNWYLFLIWLKKINLRHLKTPKLNTTNERRCKKC